jgi:hypothetical protein
VRNTASTDGHSVPLAGADARKSCAPSTTTHDVVFPLSTATSPVTASVAQHAPADRARRSRHRDARFTTVGRLAADTKYDGRPHWDGIRDAQTTDAVVSKFGAFSNCEALDPTGRMLNAHLRALFGIAA